MIVLSLEKETYLVDEAIWFEAVEKNLTEEVVYSSVFRPAARAYCDVILKDGGGKQWPYRGGMDNIPYMPERWSGHEMVPGQERYLVKQLHGIFGEQDEYHDIMYYLPPERYTLQVLLHTNYHWVKQYNDLYRQYGPDAQNTVEKGTIYSNEVSFEIVEPTGIEKEVHQKLLEAYKLDWERTQGSTVNERIYPIYKDIVNNYPNSVYTINAYFNTLSYLTDKAGLPVDRRRQLELFSDRIYSYRIVRGLRKDIADEILPLYQKNHPESRVAKYIKHEYKYGALRERK